MAMDSSGATAAAIAESILGPLQPTGDSAQDAALAAQRTAFLQAICAAVVQHIQSQAQVLVISVAGVTTGPSASGPGTGTVL